MKRREFAVTGTLRLKVRMRSGDIRIEQTTDGGATAHVTRERADDEVSIDHQVSDDGTRLTITQRRDGWGFRSQSLHVAVTVPAGTIVDIATASGDVTIEGAIAELTMGSGSGDATIERVLGDARLRGASGDVRADEVGGDLTVTTASGEIEVGRVSGRIEARTASGDIEVSAAGGSARAVSASGDVSIGSASADVFLRTVSGDIEVGVPAGTRVWLDVSSTSGDTASDLDPGATDDGGDAAFEIRASSVSGDIHVRRAPALRAGAR